MVIKEAATLSYQVQKRENVKVILEQVVQYNFTYRHRVEEKNH